MHNSDINPFIEWLLSKLAPSEGGKQGPIDFEAHGCYDMGYDCDSSDLFG
jgi:hypothetical protein